MHRKLSIPIVAAVAVIGLTLAGCSAGGESEGPTKISFWNAFTGPDRPFVEKIVQDFNASQSDVVVDMNIQPGDVYSQRLLPAYAAGEGPTIAAFDASQFPAYAEAGVLAPVDDLYDSGQLDPKTLPAASLEATTWDGKVYGVPMISATSMLYWNKDLFAAAGLQGPPTTMDELVADAKALTKYTEGQDTTNQYGFLIPEREAVQSWALLIWAEGGSIVSDDNTKSTFGSKKTIDAVTYWNDLIQKDHISPVGLTGVDGDSLFGAGRGAMVINGPWASGGYTEAGVNFDVASVPAGPAGQFANAISVNMHLNAAATDAEKKAAYEFFTYWNSKESQTYYAVNAGFPPNRTDIPASDLAANPTSAKFSEATGGKFYLAGLTGFADIDGNVVIPTIQRITSGQGTPADLLPPAGEQIDAILAK